MIKSKIKFKGYPKIELPTWLKGGKNSNRRRHKKISNKNK